MASIKATEGSELEAFGCNKLPSCVSAGHPFSSFMMGSSADDGQLVKDIQLFKTP